ncbi:hypothetical protein [Streptomyces sp. 061-3]|uniref:hypothetical protein n=1 Tax=Streptomyces sp. 061-3 TaxID=2789268 RepID=UPI003981053F
MPIDLRPRDGSGRGELLCSYHGSDCQLGRVWPPPEHVLELQSMIREAQLAVGQAVPDVDPYTVDRHKPMSKAERRDWDGMLQEAKDKVAAEEAAIIAGGTV